jgi:hypothetical protein
MLTVALSTSCALEVPSDPGESETKIGDLGENLLAPIDALAPALVPQPAASAHRIVCREGASGLPVQVVWIAQPAQGASELTASIKNTTPNPMSVRPSLRMYSPQGDFREAFLTPVVIPAGGTSVVAVPVAALPVQSQGLPSTAELFVSWDRHVSGVAVTEAVRTFTPPVHVTVDGTGRRLVVRSGPEQMAFERSERTAGREARLVALSFADAVTGQMRAAAPQELALKPTLSLGVAELGGVAP